MKQLELFFRPSHTKWNLPLDSAFISCDFLDSAFLVYSLVSFLDSVFLDSAFLDSAFLAYFLDSVLIFEN